jgi:hypothetical protein
MAKVIRGAFPRHRQEEASQEQKPIGSYILHISITFSDPLIWRRVQVPARFTLGQLHRVIQQSMGWSDSHVHQFLVGKICYEPTSKATFLKEAKRFDENLYRLYTLEEDMRFLFTYFYGAGEGWEHLIQLEEVLPANKELQTAQLLAGSRACPPEIMGDIHEYQQFLAKLAPLDRKEQSRFLKQNNLEGFVADELDLDAVAKKLAAIH